jgi:hypothetical protein
MAVQLSDKVVMAASVYPKEANPLWGDIYNNRCSYFKSYSSHTFDYPIQSGIRIGRGSGMEYPMICWNLVVQMQMGDHEQIKNGMMEL